MKQLLLTLTATVALTAQAHDIWIVPSQTQLSGKDAWVTFDAAASNQMFVANHASLDLKNFTVNSPSNQHIDMKNAMEGKVRSVFDIQLTENGTYQVMRGGEGSVFARYKKADGGHGRWRGSVEEFKAGNYPKAIPADAFRYYVGQVETFVTLGKPSQESLTPSPTGVDVEYLTHPNGLFSNSSSEFRAVIDGKGAKDLTVTIIRGGSQYRNSTEAQKITTSEDGKFSVKWDKAGMYWLSIEAKDDKSPIEGSQRYMSYSVVLQVLPE